MDSKAMPALQSCEETYIGVGFFAGDSARSSNVGDKKWQTK